MLGGSSAINVLGFVFPSRSVLDSWAALGNDGWDWNGVQPYLRKFNTHHRPSKETAKTLGLEYTEASDYGTSGPIHTSFPASYGPLGQAWAETFKQLGFPATGDAMKGSLTGGFNITSTINPETWERSHAGSGYYAPIAHRTNLKVIVECTVQKLQLEKGESGRVTATGVYATHRGQNATYKAKNEVLLCAGSFHSPQILELSGIGNPDILQTHGIEPVVINPHIGENLQDHVLTGCCYEVNDGVPTFDMIRDPKVAEAAMQAYTESRTGPLTSSFHSWANMPLAEGLSEELLSLLKDELAKVHNPHSPAEASQYAMIRQVLENPREQSALIGSGPAQAHHDASTQRELFAISDPHNYMCILLGLSRPFSRGTVHIQSSNVNDLPAVDPKYFSHPIDLEILGRHMQWTRKIRETKPLADFLKPDGVTIPRDLDVETLEFAKEHIRRNLVTYNHPCGTCAMMPEKLGGVVDARLKVYGVSHLRIVDASIFPLIPNVSIQSTVYAMAEKAADLIKEDYR